MKKSFILMATAIAALAMTSCAQDEVVSQNPSLDVPVAFDTYAGNAVRTTVVTGDVLKAGFGVFAFYTGDGETTGDTVNDYDKAQHTTPDFMYNQKVEDTNSGWTYAPVKYWPNNDYAKVSFFAYAPYDGSKEWDASNPTIPVTIAADVNNHIDYLACTPQLNQQKPAVNGAVNFEFSHATARIDLYAAAAVDQVAAGNTLDANTTIVINKVTLGAAEIDKGFYVAGDLNLNDAKLVGTTAGETPADTDFQALVWEGETDLQNYTITGDSHATMKQINKVTLDADGKVASGAVAMVIPSAEMTIDVTIDYTVTTIDGGLSGDSTNNSGNSVVNNVITRSLTITPTANRIHKINMLIGMTSVKVSAEVADWQTAGTNKPSNHDDEYSENKQ